MNKIINKEKLYIIDFLNIISDFREIKYKKQNIDFHTIKHRNIEQDTYDFFELFFTKYIERVNINKNSLFMFIMKKLNGYDVILDKVMKKIPEMKVTFCIIEDKYNNVLIDKNKDDFLCQYLMYTMKNTYDCVLISNDKYRDAPNYIKLFNFNMCVLFVKFIKEKGQIQKNENIFKICSNNDIGKNMMISNYKRVSIPKHNLNSIL